MFFALRFAASVRALVTRVRQNARISAFHAVRVRSSAAGSECVRGLHGDGQPGPPGVEGLVRCAGQQLDDGLPDRPDDGQLEVGGQDLVQPRPLHRGQVGVLGGEQRAVLPRRVDRPAPPAVRFPTGDGGPG